MGRGILIVDDEKLIRQGIRARLDYLGFEFDTIREADHGKTALSVLLEEDIDIVITDIRMTGMDGIDFIRESKPLYPRIQFIILSGYAEFSYAEQAINLGASAYLLKPIANDQLKSTMENVIRQIDIEQQNNKTLRLAKQSLKKNDEHILGKDFNALLHQTDPFKEESLVLMENIKVHFPIENRKFMIALINIDGESYDNNKFGYQDIKVIHFSVKNIFGEMNTKSQKIIINKLSNTNQLFAILSNECTETLKIEAERLFAMLQGVLWSRMNISSTIGISSVINYLSMEGTREAQEAFNQRLIHGTGNIYFYNDIKLLTASSLPTGELHMLNQYIERNDIGNIQFVINMIFSDERIQQYNVNYIRMMWVRIIGILLKSTNTRFEKEMQKAEQLVVDLDELVSLSSLVKLREYLWTMILDCLEIDTNKDINAKNKICLAIKYIESYYNTEITINDLAERFTMSPNYFSALFKKETGQTTINYIKECRLKKAKGYLVQSDKSVVEIAKEVGYEDSQYFFKVFKKATGQTPLHYRKHHKQL